MLSLGIFIPCISTSLVARRNIFDDGLEYLSTSSTKLEIISGEGSFFISSYCSGFLVKSHIPSVIDAAVVSFPATKIWLNMDRDSAFSRGFSPSMLALTICERISSSGFSRRSSILSTKYFWNSMTSRAAFSNPSLSNCPLRFPTNASVHFLKSGISSSGAPS